MFGSLCLGKPVLSLIFPPESGYLEPRGLDRGSARLSSIVVRGILCEYLPFSILSQSRRKLNTPRALPQPPCVTCPFHLQQLIMPKNTRMSCNMCRQQKRKCDLPHRLGEEKRICSRCSLLGKECHFRTSGETARQRGSSSELATQPRLDPNNASHDISRKEVGVSVPAAFRWSSKCSSDLYSLRTRNKAPHFSRKQPASLNIKRGNSSLSLKAPELDLRS